MRSSIEIVNSNNTNTSKFFIFLIVAIAIFMNQSNIIFGANISIADLFSVIALLFLIINNRLLFPVAPTLFFLMLSAIILFASTFYIPIAFEYYPQPLNIVVSYLKIMVVFIYFIIGYSIYDQRLVEKTVKWYSMIALFIGVVGIIFTILNINLFSQNLFLGTRFKGLMNDPNYFAIIQVSALVYFTRTKSIGILARRISVVLIVISILVSGSKTGFITLSCYFLIRILEYIFKSKKKPTTLIKNMAIIISISLIITYISSYLQELLHYISSIIPAFSRVEQLFMDFDASISGSGSSRDTTWKVAIEIIKMSPIIGIGVGTYTGISEKFFNTNLIAHNTYLQLFTEWGLLLSIVLFSYIFFIIGKVTIKKDVNTELNCILRDILIVFLIGSIAISLNNARMVWFFLGMLIFSVKIDEKTKGQP